MKHFSACSILAMSLAFASPAVVSAQDYAFQGFAAAEAMNEMHSAVRENMIVSPSGERRGGSSRAASTPPSTRQRAAPVGETAYRVDPAIRRKVESRIVQAVSRSDADAGRRLAEAFGRRDFVRLFDQAMGGFGLRSGDAVDALTAYWLASWGAANNYQRQPSRTQVQAVRNQVRSGFDLARAGLTTSHSRQEFAETLIYQTILLDTAMEQAQKSGNRANIRRLGDEAQRQMRLAGLNMRQLRLTDQGFVAR